MPGMPGTAGCGAGGDGRGASVSAPSGARAPVVCMECACATISRSYRGFLKIGCQPSLMYILYKDKVLKIFQVLSV